VVVGPPREPHGRRVGERLVPLLSSYQLLVLLGSGRKLGGFSVVRVPLTRTGPRTRAHTNHKAYCSPNHTYTQHEQRTSTAWAANMHPSRTARTTHAPRRIACDSQSTTRPVRRGSSPLQLAASACGTRARGGAFFYAQPKSQEKVYPQVCRPSSCR
jgi:hypothetical protein